MSHVHVDVNCLYQTKKVKLSQLNAYQCCQNWLQSTSLTQKKNHVLINWRKHRLVCEKILGRLLCNLPITTYSTIKHQTETKSVRKKYHIMGIQKLLPKNINDIFNNLEMLILPKWCIPIHDTFLPTKNKIHLSILWRHISMQVSIA